MSFVYVVSAYLDMFTPTLWIRRLVVGKRLAIPEFERAELDFGYFSQRGLQRGGLRILNMIHKAEQIEAGSPSPTIPGFDCLRGERTGDHI